METIKILTGHTSYETAYKIAGYPWGFKLRTSQFVWIETVKGKGDRVCRATIDPRSNKLCATKKSTFSPFKYLFLDEKSHVQSGGIEAYYLDEFKDKIQFLIDKIEVASEEQIFNLRNDYLAHFRGNCPYVLVKYSDERKPQFKAWAVAYMKHILNSEIDQWFNFEAAPEQDNSEGEVKMTVTTYGI